jgi:hypothetical protein
MWTPSDALELLDDLSELAFPDHLFQRIHPKGHSMARYRGYCEGLQKRFTRASSSQLLCERMHLIVTYVRTSLSPPVSAATWLSVVDDAVKQAGNGSRGYRRLSEQHQPFLAEQIAKLVEVAIDRRHPMRWVAEWQIRNTLWRWTVDGVSSNGTVVVDAAKADVTMWPITRRAQATAADRIHEHVVPRVVITRHLIEQRMMDVDEIVTALRRHCLAAVVTEADDDELNRHRLRESMPDGWRWGDDPWARYRAANLYDTLIWPDDWPRGG